MAHASTAPNALRDAIEALDPGTLKPAGVDKVSVNKTGNTYTVKDDAATTLVVFGASPATPQAATFYYDGTHYVFLNFWYVEV